MRQIVITLGGVVLFAFIGSVLAGLMGANNVNPTGAGITQVIIHISRPNSGPTMQHPKTGK